jgi:hypothetical protein
MFTHTYLSNLQIFDEAHNLFVQTELNTSYKTLQNLQDMKRWKKCTNAKSLLNQSLQMNRTSYEISTFFRISIRRPLPKPLQGNDPCLRPNPTLEHHYSEQPLMTSVFALPLQ